MRTRPHPHHSVLPAALSPPPTSPAPPRPPQQLHPRHLHPRRLRRRLPDLYGRPRRALLPHRVPPSSRPPPSSQTAHLPSQPAPPPSPPINPVSAVSAGAQNADTCYFTVLTPSGGGADPVHREGALSSLYELEATVRGPPHSRPGPGRTRPPRRPRPPTAAFSALLRFVSFRCVE